MRPFRLVLSLVLLPWSPLDAACGLAALAQPVTPAAERRLAALEDRVRVLEAALTALRSELLLAAAADPRLAALEGRLAALEAGARDLAAEAARLRADAAREKQEREALADTVDRQAQAEAEKLDVSVYGVLDVVARRGNDLQFDGKAFELVFSGRPHARLGVFAEVEFEQAAGVGAERGGEVVVEQAYANLVFRPGFNLRAGILLVPFGNVNLDHFAPRRDMVNKPFASLVIAPSDWTDNGLGFYGRFNAGESWRVAYEAYAIGGLGEPIDARGTRSARLGYGADNNADKALVGRLSLSRRSRLELGLSGYRGRYDAAGRSSLDGVAVDGVLTLGPLKLSGEYDRLDAEGGAGVRMTGGHGRATLSLPARWLPEFLLHDFQEPALQAVAQYDWAGLQGRGPEGTPEHNRERRITVGFNYRPARQLVLKLDYEFASVFGEPIVIGGADGFAGSIGFVF